MERNDFISGDAYYRYKFERESKNEEIQRLRTKMERMRTDNYRGNPGRNEQRLAV